MAVKASSRRAVVLPPTATTNTDNPKDDDNARMTTMTTSDPKTRAVASLPKTPAIDAANPNDDDTRMIRPTSEPEAYYLSMPLPESSSLSTSLESAPTEALAASPAQLLLLLQQQQRRHDRKSTTPVSPTETKDVGTRGRRIRDWSLDDWKQIEEAHPRDSFLHDLATLIVRRSEDDHNMGGGGLWLPPLLMDA